MKKIPYWLRGAIIGILLAILVNNIFIEQIIVVLHLDFLFVLLQAINPPQFLADAIYLPQQENFSNTSQFISLAISVIYLGCIGAFCGWVYGRRKRMPYWIFGSLAGILLYPFLPRYALLYNPAGSFFGLIFIAAALGYLIGKTNCPLRIKAYLAGRKNWFFWALAFTTMSFVFSATLVYGFLHTFSFSQDTMHIVGLLTLPLYFLILGSGGTGWPGFIFAILIGSGITAFCYFLLGALLGKMYEHIRR